MKRRVLFVGRTRYPWPVPPEKFDALRAELDVHVLGSGNRVGRLLFHGTIERGKSQVDILNAMVKHQATWQAQAA